MGRHAEHDQGPTTISPTPFIATLCQRLDVDYGGWETISPLPQDTGEMALLLSFHVDDGRVPLQRRSRRGTGRIRDARVFADHTEIYLADRLLARFDDLTLADVVAAR